MEITYLRTSTDSLHTNEVCTTVANVVLKEISTMFHLHKPRPSRRRLRHKKETKQ